MEAVISFYIARKGFEPREGRSVKKICQWHIFSSDGRSSYLQTRKILHSKSLIHYGAPKNSQVVETSGFQFIVILVFNRKKLCKYVDF